MPIVDSNLPMQMNQAQMDARIRAMIVKLLIGDTSGLTVPERFNQFPGTPTLPGKINRALLPLANRAQPAGVRPFPLSG